MKLTLASGREIAGIRSARAEFRGPSGGRGRRPERDLDDGQQPNYRGKQDGEPEAIQRDYNREATEG